MELTFAPAVLKQIQAMPKVEAKRIVAAMREVAATHPQRMAYVTELVGRPGYWRAKKGDYRAVFTVTAAGISVVAVGHRKDIYS